MESPIGIHPDSGVSCFLCRKQVASAHRLCATCHEESRRSGFKKASSRLHGARVALEPIVKAGWLPAQYKRELVAR